MTGVMSLGVICGIVDATCLLALGGVFAERMTGNLLLLSVFLGAGELSSERLVAYVGAIAPFMMGALAAGIATNGRHPHAARVVGYRVEWVFIVAATVTAVIVSAGIPGDQSESLFLTDGIIDQDMIPPPARLVIVGLLAFAMGIHNALMRRHGVSDVATNVLTLTLAGLVSESRLARGVSTQWQRRLGSILLYMVGAVIGAALLRWDVSAPLVAASILFTIVLWPLTRGPRPAPVT